MTAEQAVEALTLLSDILDTVRFCFAAIAVGTGVSLAGALALFLIEH